MKIVPPLRGTTAAKAWKCRRLTQIYRAHSGLRLVAEHRPRVVVPVAQYSQHVLHGRGVPVGRHLFVPVLPGHATLVGRLVQLRILQMEQPGTVKTAETFVPAGGQTKTVKEENRQ